MATIIKAKKDLYNGGKCFTKGKEYRTDKNIQITSSLIETAVTNDLGESHLIGMWWRDFSIVKHV